jgi:hypothetical protein
VKPNNNKRSSSTPDTKVEVTGGEIDVKEESGYYDAYKGFATNLRVWFIAYGIGAPAVLLSNENSWATIVDSGQGKKLAILFFIGVGIQVFATLLYKAAMWYLYMTELGHIKKDSKKYRVSNFFASNYIVESVFDTATFLLFGWASFIVIKIIVDSI